VGAAAGWLEGEFVALGVPFEERGPRTDEAIDVLRACWDGPDPVRFRGPTVVIEDMSVQPRPERRIPIWVGGASPAALRRAAAKGDGWHGTFMEPSQAAPLLAMVREARPEPEFILSMRTSWDGLRGDEAEIKRQAEEFVLVGVQHLLVSPAQGDESSWMRSVEELWRMLSPVA
jgi:hypothetical protein